MTAVRVVAQPLSAERWAPFGWLPMDEDDEESVPAATSRRLAFDAADPHLNVIGHHADEVATVDGTLVCHELYRHDHHTQALLVLDHRAVIAVAGPAVRFDRASDGAEVHAFVLEPLDALVIGAGTWHWGPFPLGAPAVRLLNLQARGYRDDNTRVGLAELGIDVEVVAGA